MTPSYQAGNGRCRCGGVKSLKFKWKQNPLARVYFTQPPKKEGWSIDHPSFLDHPSFFGGCVKYTHNDRHLHHSAKSCPGTTWKIMEKHRMAMMPSDVRLLYNRCSHLLLQKISMIWWPKLLVVRSNTFHPSQRKMLAFFSRNFAPL